MSEKPLSGIRVIEFGQIASGPFTGMLLGDLGAEVIKVERPEVGDGMRNWPPIKKGEGEEFSENFASLNRNKRSITIDFNNKEDCHRIKKLSEEVDVIIENFRPGVLNKKGLGYEDLKKGNPKLVYCSISGYGQQGVYSQRGAYDVTIQAISGLMSVTGENNREPVKCGVPIADFAAGLYASYSILALVIKRQNNGGKGGYIDCSMIGSILGISALQTSEYYGNKVPPQRLGSAHPRNAPYQGFHGSDKPFIIAAGNNILWKKVTKIVDMPCLYEEERFATQELRAENQKELESILNGVFKNKSSSYWLERCNEEGVPCAPINDFSEILEDPHIKEMGITGELKLPNNLKTNYVGYPIKLSNFDFEVYLPPPKLGEHNKEFFEKKNSF